MFDMPRVANMRAGAKIHLRAAYQKIGARGAQQRRRCQPTLPRDRVTTRYKVRCVHARGSLQVLSSHVRCRRVYDARLSSDDASAAQHVDMRYAMLICAARE